MMALYEKVEKLHNAKVIGDAPAKVIATYVVERGKPLATPAP